jgi:aminoglycoside 3-N-acetyltransferase
MYRCDLNALKCYLISFKIPKGSTVIIHSSLLKFGIIDGGLDGLIKMLQEIFDESYTIAVPTFTFKFSSHRIWDYENTKSETGVFSEAVRKMEGSLRSIHPIHSIAVYGPHAQYLTSDITETSFCAGSTFEKFYKLNAYNLSLGSEFVDGGASFCHYAEEILNVPYRFYKEFPGEVTGKDNQKIDMTFKMFVRLIESDHEHINRWDIYWDDAMVNGLIRYDKFNSHTPIFLMNITDSHDFLYERISKDPYYVAERISRK